MATGMDGNKEHGAGDSTDGNTDSMSHQSAHHIAYHPGCAVDDKEKMFQRVLHDGIVDLALLKKLCYTGIPEACRPLAYQIVLGVIGLDPHAFQVEQATLQSRYEKYMALDLLSRREERHPSARTARQIEIDIRRIHPSHRKTGTVDLSPVFTNILRVSARKRPFIGYVQGMADLIIPFTRIFSAEICHAGSAAQDEPLIYFCFSHLLNRIQKNIMEMQASLLSRLEQVLRVVDKELLYVLEEKGLQLYMICFRWFSCLFIREFPIDSWLRIFDSMICGDIDDFCVFFGAALLLWLRDDIRAGDFSTVMLTLQNIQERNLTVDYVETLIGSSNHLKRECQGKQRDKRSDTHLRMT